MPIQAIFYIHLALGYVAWMLVFLKYFRHKLQSAGRISSLTAIAALHSFRFFGLVFIIPGVVGSLPAGFAAFAAYGDFATGVLAIAAMLTVRIRLLFWFFVLAFNIVGTTDILVDYVHGVQIGLADFAGQLGLGYPIVILYVPALMITHIAAFIVLVRYKGTRHATAVAPA